MDKYVFGSRFEKNYYPMKKRGDHISDFYTGPLQRVSAIPVTSIDGFIFDDAALDEEPVFGKPGDALWVRNDGCIISYRTTIATPLMFAHNKASVVMVHEDFSRTTQRHKRSIRNRLDSTTLVGGVWSAYEHNNETYLTELREEMQKFTASIRSGVVTMRMEVAAYIYAHQKAIAFVKWCGLDTIGILAWAEKDLIRQIDRVFGSAPRGVRQTTAHEEVCLELSIHAKNIGLDMTDLLQVA